MKRAAIYVRVSTSSQSNHLQIEELVKYAKNRGWGEIKVFSDIGTGTNVARNGLADLLMSARQRQFDIILIWKLDRLFRSLKDLVITVSELEEIDVALVSLKDQIDLTTSTGRLMVHLLGAFAQFEADLIRARVQAGVDRAREKGTVLGRPRLNKEAEIHQLRAKGLSYQQIQIRLKVSKGTVWRALKSYPKNLSQGAVLNIGNDRGEGG